MRRIQHVIWDFDGTLLDDVECSVASSNELLERRALAPMSRLRHRASLGSTPG